MQTEINYTVNLANPNAPTGDITFTFTNNSRLSSGTSKECIQAGSGINELPLDQRDYIMNDCYWSYLRVYTPALSQLTSSTPYEIPQGWPLRETAIPAKTDVLDENIPGVQAFGTLLVIPIGETRRMSFSYDLPASVVSAEPGNSTYKYSLKIQKQPGTLAVPLTLHIVLPPGMTITKMPPGLLQDRQNEREWILDSNMDMDLSFEIYFQPIA
jgi:hypothetical protein